MISHYVVTITLREVVSAFCVSILLVVITPFCFKYKRPFRDTFLAVPFSRPTT